MKTGCKLEAPCFRADQMYSMFIKATFIIYFQTMKGKYMDFQVKGMTKWKKYDKIVNNIFI